MRPENQHRADLSALLASLVLGLAWLVPNHYLPWTSFYGESLAGVSLLVLLVGLAFQRTSAKTHATVWLCLGFALVPVIQLACGQILFLGDATLASVYLAALGLSIHVGSQRPDFVGRLLPWTVVVVSVLSLGLALCQWLRVDLVGLFMTDMPQNGRPFANLAQPNLLAALFVLALACTVVLFESRAVGIFTALLLAVLLSFGLAMTQSRTAWFQVCALCAVLLAGRWKSVSMRTRPVVVGGLLLVFVVWVLLWPMLCDALFLSPGRSGTETASRGVRLLHWTTLLDAVRAHPLTGYGWNQVVMAQAGAAPEHPASFELIEHSHNLLLDLVVWNGVPLGLLVIGALLAWNWRLWKAVRSPQQVAFVAALAAFALHSLLEFPLEFMYFLIPAGLIAGHLESLGESGRAEQASRFTWRHRSSLMAVVVLGALCLAVIVNDYLKLENNHRQLRYESARIGPDPTQRAPAPDVLLLTQQQAFLRFARMEARLDMSAEDLAFMRKVAMRYPFPPVLFRFAMASALNADPVSAQQSLVLLCKLNEPARCDEGRFAWRAGASKYPEMAFVQFPETP